MKKANTAPKACNMVLPDAERKYEIDGKTCVVKPVYKEKASDSVLSILVKLIKSER
ncbi:hypothetical protein FACS189492_0690 [Clostridia bacterium]|nr:hypothetical protein FACS189492_0690 [Clostridia bacterium]